MASAIFPYSLAGGVNDRLGVSFLMPGRSARRLLLVELAAASHLLHAVMP